MPSSRLECRDGRDPSGDRLGRILLLNPRVTLPDKRLTNRRQVADRRAAPRPGAIDRTRQADSPAHSPVEAICPKCGSPRTAPTAQVVSGSRKLNLFRCETCHSRFVRSTEAESNTDVVTRVGRDHLTIREGVTSWGRRYRLRASWVTLNCSPAMMSVVLLAAPGFSSTSRRTLPSPEPRLPLSIVTQPTGLDAVHGHPSLAFTSTSS